MGALMMALHADLEDGQPARPLYGEMLAATLAAYLVKRFSVRPVAAMRAGGGIPKARLKRVLEFISAHLSDEIRLETLASIAGMSRHHFSELFRCNTGVSPYQYVIGQRVEPESKCSEPPIRASSKPGSRPASPIKAISPKSSGALLE